MLVRTSGLSVKKSCELLELQRGRYHRWFRAWKKEGPEGLRDKMSGPENCPHSLLEEEKQAVYEEADENPEVKHRKLAYQLQNKGICFVSESSVYRLLNERGLIKKREKITGPKAPDTRDDGPEEPNQQWHTDVTYIGVNGRWAKLVSFLDGYSRKIIHWRLAYSILSREVSRVYDEAVGKEGLLEEKDKPDIISDNGPRFVGRHFTGLLEELGVKHRRIPVNHPESNGKIEVFHKTLKYESVYRQEEYETLADARKEIGKFIRHYNENRLHQGIDYVTPVQKHEGKAEGIIEERKRKHKEAIEKRKMINRKRSENGKTKVQIKESV